MMETKRGWWRLIYIGDIDELNESDREHIADLVRQGYNQGELIHQIEDDEVIES